MRIGTIGISKRLEKEADWVNGELTCNYCDATRKTAKGMNSHLGTCRKKHGVE